MYVMARSLADLSELMSTFAQFVRRAQLLDQILHHLTHTHTHARTHTHTHTHQFNDPLSGTTRVSRYQKSRTNLDFTEARDSEWQWHQLGHIQVFISLHR